MHHFLSMSFESTWWKLHNLLRDVEAEIQSQFCYLHRVSKKKCHTRPIENKDGDDGFKAAMQCFKVFVSLWAHSTTTKEHWIVRNYEIPLIGYGAYRNKDACKSGRKGDTHHQDDDWWDWMRLRHYKTKTRVEVQKTSGGLGPMRVDNRCGCRNASQCSVVITCCKGVWFDTVWDRSKEASPKASNDALVNLVNLQI